MFKFGDWINRKRHNRGFGIQSPSAFFFITQVLKEKRPYYAYRELDRIIAECGGMSRRDARELFRITNYLKPDNCIAVASVAAAHAMKAARPKVPFYILETGTEKEFLEIMEKCTEPGMLYIGNTPHRSALLETAMSRTNNRSAIVIEGISRDKASRELWQKIIDDQRTIVTYDMHRYGLLLFDREKKKQNYKLKR